MRFTARLNVALIWKPILLYQRLKDPGPSSHYCVSCSAVGT